MIKIPALCLLVLVFTVSLHTQFLHKQSPSDGFQLNKPKLSLKESAASKQKLLYKKTDMPTPLLVLGIVSLISPMVVFEDKKTFFALTKEVSFGKFPLGRFSFEYSYIFRSFNTSHLRLSYNYDIIMEAASFVAIVATPGAGYFTDTKNKGWFLQASGGLFLAIAEPWVIHPYLRYRHTFIKDKAKTDINDISFGSAFILYF